MSYAVIRRRVIIMGAGRYTAQRRENNHTKKMSAKMIVSEHAHLAAFVLTGAGEN